MHMPMVSRFFKTIPFFLLLSGPSWPQSGYTIKPVDLRRVTVEDSFWSPRLRRNATVTIPALFEKCRETGRIKNFEMAARRSGKFCTRYSFDDTDVYKSIEAASWSLMSFPDPGLESLVDSLIRLIGRAQEEDGYLFTERTIDPVNTSRRIGPERWVNEQLHSHELYNAGHLYEAAYAHFLATGKRTLLSIALKNANLVDNVFGVNKKQVAPGHQVIEMGLVKLYMMSGEKRYFDLARFFLEARGRRTYDPGWERTTFSTGEYWQDHKPAKDQREAVGHAVRAMYMYAAMADVMAMSNDSVYWDALTSCWENVTSGKMYITGGLGAAGDGERFGANYELPNRTAYTETCAAIGSVFWNYRMFLLSGDAKYLDVVEQTLYNGILSGIGLDGRTFFYTNAIEVRDFFRHADLETRRSEWFVCSCCPPNLARLMASLPSYAYAQRGHGVFINLYLGGRAEFQIDHEKLQLETVTKYPWEGQVRIRIVEAPTSTIKLHIRIPGWSDNRPVPSDLYAFTHPSKAERHLLLNGKPVTYTVANGFAEIERKFVKGDIVELNLPMEIRFVKASPKLESHAGKIAIQRGPLMYCIEAADNGGSASQFILDEDRPLKSSFQSEILGGVTVLTGEMPAVFVDPDRNSVTSGVKKLTAIPYYAWANRTPGELTLWFPSRVLHLDLIPE